MSSDDEEFEYPAEEIEDLEKKLEEELEKRMIRILTDYSHAC